jgi:hypothetical protein
VKLPIPDDDLSPEEAAAFAALPGESVQHDAISEQRVVQELRARGLLSAPSRSIPRPVTIAAAIAAALLMSLPPAAVRRLPAKVKSSVISPAPQDR